MDHMYISYAYIYIHTYTGLYLVFGLIRLSSCLVLHNFQDAAIVLQRRAGANMLRSPPSSPVELGDWENLATSHS